MVGSNKPENKAASKVKQLTWSKLATRTMLHVALAIFTISLLSYVAFFSFKSSEHNALIANFLAKHYAGLVHQVIVDESTKFVTIIQDKILPGWRPGEDEFLLQKRVAAVKQIVPSVKAFYIVYPEQKEPKPNQTELGYAALAMAGRVFQGQKVQPEIHRIENNEYYIDHVFPLSVAGNHIEAAAIVSQEVSVFQKVFKQNDIPGFMELRETLLGQNRLITKNDRIDLAGVGIQAATMVPETTWKINFWLDPKYTNSLHDGLVCLAFAILLIISGALYLIWRDYRSVARYLQHDKETLARMLEAVLEHRNMTQEPSFYFKIFNQLGKYVEQIGAQPKNIKLTKRYHDEMQPIMDWAMISEISSHVEPSIFRAYDIRGVAGKTLSAGIMHILGKSIGSEIVTKNGQPLVFGRDGRLSGDEFSAAFCQGVRSTGIDVIDIGVVPTPLVYFGAHHLQTGNAVVLTGSHNPPDYNGLKIVIDGETLAENKIQALLHRIQRNEFVTGEGAYEKKDLLADYIAEVVRHAHLERPLKVVVDAGNGVGGVLACPLLKALGCDVVEIFCEVDGTFPNHHPDPSQESSLQALIQMVQTHQADLGFALDGDGDRLGVVTPGGEIIWPDRLMMLYAQDVLSRHPGAPILYDVKCSKHLTEVIEAAGGKAVMCQTGHSLVKRALKRHDGILAGEMSGHFFFKENWYGFDDACFAAVKLLTILASDREQRNLDQLFERLPKSFATPEINIAISDEEKFDFIENLKANHGLTADNIITLDGLRVEFQDGWGLVRVSNTTPNLVLRFEADTETALKRIQADFKALLLKLNPDLNIPF